MAAGGADPTGAPRDAVALLAEFLAQASIEIAPGRPQALDALREHFDPGTEVFVNFLPNGDAGAVAETAVQVRRAGFVPVPHVAARNIADPPEACTVSIHTPSRVADATAPAT